MKKVKFERRRKFALFLAFVLCLSTLNMSVFAEGNDKVLTCEKEEHEHEGTCSNADGEYICGKEEHKHGGTCYEYVTPEPDEGDGKETEGTETEVPDGSETNGTGTGTGTGSNMPCTECHRFNGNHDEGCSLKPCAECGGIGGNHTEECYKPAETTEPEATGPKVEYPEAGVAVWSMPNPENPDEILTLSVGYSFFKSRIHPDEKVLGNIKVENKTWGTVSVSGCWGDLEVWNSIPLSQPVGYAVKEDFEGILCDEATVTIKLASYCGGGEYSFTVTSTEVEVVPKHTYGDWIIDEEAGVRYRDCVLGDDRQIEEIPVEDETGMKGLAVTMTPIGARYDGSDEIIAGEYIDGVYTVPYGAKTVLWEIEFTNRNGNGTAWSLWSKGIDGALYEGKVGTDGKIVPIAQNNVMIGLRDGESYKAYVKRPVANNPEEATVQYYDANDSTSEIQFVSSVIAIGPEKDPENPDPVDPENPNPTDPENPDPTDPDPTPTPNPNPTPTPGPSPDPTPSRGSDPDPAPNPAPTPDPTPAPVVTTPVPTPVVTPAPVPVAPTPAAEPEVPVAAAPEAEALVEIGAEETPLASAEGTEEPAEPEEILLEDEEVPLAINDASWALLNLILAIATAVASVILLIGYFGKKQEEEEGEERYEVKRKGMLRAASLIPTVVAFVVFILTENVKNPMVLIDRYTWVMLVIALTQLVVCVLAHKKKEELKNDQGPKALA